MKSLLNRIPFGIIGGVFYGFVISLFFSYYYQLNYLQPSSDEFVKHFSNNLNATLVSAILWALIGLVFSLSGKIFTIENWGITKQTVIHFIVTFILFTPLAILAGWFPLDPGFLILFTFIFILIYIFMWSLSFFKAHKNLKLINDELKKYKIK